MIAVMPAPKHSEARRLPPAHRRLLDAVRIGLGVDPEAELPRVDAATARLAVQHRVHPVVAAAAERFGADTGAHAVFTLKRAQDRAASEAQVAEMLRLAPALEDAEIPHLFFKGPALALQTGRQPAERVGGDVDLLVRPGDWIGAHRVLDRCGFGLRRGPQPGDDTRTRFLLWSWWEAHYLGETVEIDLHWRPEPGKHAGLDPAEVFGRRASVDVDGAVVATFDPHTALAHTALRASRIGWSELRSVVDAYLLATVAGADWDRAAAVIPGLPAVEECRRAAAALVSERLPAGTGDAWVRGFVSGERPSTGLRHDLRQVAALSPSWRSKAAITLHWAIPPESMVGLPRSLWFLGILGAPMRLARRGSKEQG
jgi:hypothetical protein